MTGSEWFNTRAGGLNRYFSDLYGALRNLNEAEVDAAAFGVSPEGEVSWGPAAGGTVRRVQATRRATTDLRNVDIVDFHFALYGPRISQIKGAVKVVHFQGPWAEESRASGDRRLSILVKRQVELARYRKVDHFIVLSAPFRDVLVDQYGVPADAISILSPGVDLERFSSRNRCPITVSANPVVLCVRRLERRMGIDVLINSWRDVALVYPHAQLRIVGTGNEEDSLRALALRSPYSSQIHFLGRVGDTELIEEYERSTITVVPTRELEGFGLIALESMAIGKPPIVTDCGGLPDAVRGLDPSLIVPIENQDALARRIIAALKGDRPSADLCVRHAQAFSWREVARRHIDLYQNLKSANA